MRLVDCFQNRLPQPFLPLSREERFFDQVPTFLARGQQQAAGDVPAISTLPRAAASSICRVVSGCLAPCRQHDTLRPFQVSSGLGGVMNRDGDQPTAAEVGRSLPGEFDSNTVVPPGPRIDPRNESEIASSEKTGDSTASQFSGHSPVFAAPREVRRADGGGALAGRVLGDFDVASVVGRGTFGEVYKALDRKLQRTVALKVERIETPESILVAKLSHQHVVQVYGQHDQGELRLFSLEFLPGGTLRQVIERVRRTRRELRDGRLLIEAIEESLDRNEFNRAADRAARNQLADQAWWQVVCKIGKAIAYALAHSHAREIVHRDVKPANILLSAAGVPKLADFSSSVTSDENLRSGVGLGGTLPYLPPEQLLAIQKLRDHAAGFDPQDYASDRQVDVYGLAAVLWELLTGVPPFPSSSLPPQHPGYLADLMQRRAESPRLRPGDLPDDTPRELCELLERCLSTDPAARPGSALALALGLELCLHPQWQRLLSPRDGSLRAWLRPRFLSAAVVVSIAPSVLLSIANVAYDWNFLIAPLNQAHPQVVRDFVWVLVIGKLILYGGGVLAGVAFAWPIFLYFAGRSEEPIKGGRSRRVAARLPTVVLWITLAAWLISGVTFPAALWLLRAPLDFFDFANFFFAHALCGLVAGLLSFYSLAFGVLLVWYPRLLQDSLRWERDEQRTASADAALFQLDRGVRSSLLLAWSVPFCSAVAAFTLRDNYEWAFGALTVLGLLVLLFGIVIKDKVVSAVELFRTVLSSVTSAQQRPEGN